MATKTSKVVVGKTRKFRSITVNAVRNGWTIVPDFVYDPEYDDNDDDGDNDGEVYVATSSVQVGDIVAALFESGRA